MFCTEIIFIIDNNGKLAKYVKHTMYDVHLRTLEINKTYFVKKQIRLENNAILIHH